MLSREKFARFPDFHTRAQALLADIETYAFKFTPIIKVDIISDSADNRLLELAESCSADYLITGNINDFTMSEYKRTRIVPPKEFFEILNQ